MSPQLPLMYSILCGILLVLSVMLAITCLLVHHNKQLQYLKKDVNQSHIPQPLGTLRKTSSNVLDDGYVCPTNVPHPVIRNKPKPFYPRSSPSYISPNKAYENIDGGSESGHSYESIGKYCK